MVTGIRPGVEVEPRLPASEAATVPATSVRPPSSVWLVVSCTARPPGAAEGTRQKCRCCHWVTGRSAAHGSAWPKPWSISAPWQYSEATAVMTAGDSGASRRSSGTTAWSVHTQVQQGLDDRVRHHRMRGYFQEQPVPVLGGRCDGLGEPDLPPQVVHPVVGVPRRRGAGVGQSRGVERDLGVPAAARARRR